MNKKGQAAMEFLLTYGWAILVVLLVIGALAYFGLLNPRQFLPNRCNLDNSLRCDAYQLDSTNSAVRVNFINANANAIELTDASIIDESSLIICNAETYTNYIIAPGQKGNVTFICTGSGEQFLADVGTKLKVDLELKFTDKNSGFAHTSTGDMLVSVD